MQTTVFVSLMMTTFSSLLRLKPKGIISRCSTRTLCAPKSKHEMCNELLLQDTSRISFLVGPAGTGKTYAAVKAGLQSLLDGKVDKIVITKPLISVDNEQLGFLPGSVEKKLTPLPGVTTSILKAVKKPKTLAQSFDPRFRDSAEKRFAHIRP
jgi:predicted ribonuclease YlaK